MSAGGRGGLTRPGAWAEVLGPSHSVQQNCGVSSTQRLAAFPTRRRSASVRISPAPYTAPHLWTPKPQAPPASIQHTGPPELQVTPLLPHVVPVLRHGMMF